jgi:hypothetical protein
LAPWGAASDPGGGERIKVVHCQATQPVFLQPCDKIGWSGAVRYVRFREPATCLEASGAVEINITKGHMDRDGEDS